MNLFTKQKEAKMSRWLILSLMATGLLATPLLAQDPAAPKTKAKAEPKAEAPKTKTATKPKTEPPKPKAAAVDPKVRERASYALGRNFGRNFLEGIKQDEADVDLDQLLRGIKDALAQSKPAYTEEELAAAGKIFEADLNAKAAVRAKALEAKAKALAEKDKTFAVENMENGETFLAANKKKKDVQTTASGLQYKILKKGDGKTPQKTDVVQVHYHGTLPDGTVFDSSKDRGEPIEFEVTGVIRGWTEALLKMKVGDKWVLYVPADLAYGPQRRSEKIGPNQVLIFEVELLDVLDGK
ncbi:MAG: FKBP-type peptidyl-prolyl cis-trans isomerase [Pirellulaceae bacterium]